MTYHLEINNNLSWEGSEPWRKVWNSLEHSFHVKRSIEWVLESPRRIEKLVGKFQNRLFCFIFSICCHSCFPIVLALSQIVYIRVFSYCIFGIISPFKSPNLLCWNSNLLYLEYFLFNSFIHQNHFELFSFGFRLSVHLE